MAKRSDLSSYIGDMGVYQWRVFFAMFIVCMFTAESIQSIFTEADMPHWCRVLELDDLPYDVQKNVAIPAQSTDSLRDGSYVEYSSCEMFSLNYSVYNRSQFYSWNRSLMIVTNHTSLVHCSQWTYDQSQFISTIVSKFNLVCDRSLLKQLSTSLFMAGQLVGSVTSGIISDRFGRKKTMLTYCVIKLVGITMAIFRPSYATYVIGRFLTGSYMGCSIAGYIIVMELVGERYRPGLGTALQIAFSVGFMLQPAIAYRLRDEFWYQVAANTPNFLILLLIFVVFPESPRWLAVQGRYDDVSKLLHKMCETNGRQLPRDFHPKWLIDEGNVSKSKSCFLRALLATPKLRLWTLTMDFAWFTVSLMYFGLALSTGSLHGDPYLNAFLSGATEVPAYIACALMMNWKLTGRRRTGFLGLVGAAASSFVCVPMILCDFQTATTTLSILGKSLISMAFSVVYVHSSELFPTEARNFAVGTASMCARVSSLAAPFVGDPLASVWKPLPSLVFGVICTMSGLLYVFLPETLGHVLPDTIEQAERLGKTSNEIHSNPICANETTNGEASKKNSPASSVYVISTSF